MNREYLKGMCFEDEDENWWQRRTDMERCLFIGLIIAIILTIGCATFIALQYLLIEEVCSNSICLSEALKITTNLNTKTNPCEDLQFDCEQSDVKILNMLETVREEIAIKVQEPTREDEHPAISTEKELFQACINNTRSNDFLSVFEELLDDIGGWPVAVGYRWRARLYEWTEAIYMLKNRGYATTMFLFVSPTEEGKLVLSRPVATSVRHRDAYKQFMVDVAVTFGADQYQATLQMEHVLNFMEELANITVSNVTSVADELFGTEVTVNEIQKIYDEIQWLDFLNNNVYPALSVTGDDVLIIPSHEYLGEFFDLMNATPKRVQGNYMVWKVIEDIIPFMSKDLQNLKGNYSCQTEGAYKQTRFDFCTKLLNDVYFLRPSVIAYIQRHVTPEKKNHAQELFRSIKDEFAALLRNSWLDEDSTEKGANFINSIDAIIGAPENYFNGSIFDEAFIWDEEANIFKMVLSARKHLVDNFYGSISNYTFLGKLNESVNIAYVNTANTIVISVTVLDEYHKQDRPMYLNYAEIGTLIGAALAEGLFQNINELWSNATVEDLNEHIICAFGDFSNDTVKTNDVITQIGVNVAYQAYEKWAENHGKELKLIGVDHTPNQIFWISVLWSTCIKPNQELKAQLNYDFKCESNSFDKCDVF